MRGYYDRVAALREDRAAAAAALDNIETGASSRMAQTWQSNDGDTIRTFLPK